MTGSREERPITSIGPTRYSDRFQASTYDDDEPVGIFTTVDDSEAVWMPERLFSRLTAVARGYELHLLPLLGGHEPVTLNRQQVQNLLDELDFVRAILDRDVLVTASVERLVSYLAAVVTRPDVAVTVEGG